MLTQVILSDAVHSSRARPQHKMANAIMASLPDSCRKTVPDGLLGSHIPNNCERLRMMTMIKPDAYLLYSAECLVRSQGTDDSFKKAFMLDMANNWRDLANSLHMIQNVHVDETADVDAREELRLQAH